MIDRDRLTERVNVATVRIELKRAIAPLIVLAIGLVAAGAAGYYILTSINGGIGSTHTMQFEVADATGVVPGRAEVRFYGITAGQVTGVNLVHGQAVLTATVADKFGPVYKNAQAVVRPNTPLNDMYLDIVDHGTPNAGVAGQNYVVPLSQTHSPVNLADVLNTFQPDVRTQLYNMLDQLGNGLQDRGADLRRAFALLAPFLQAAGNAARQLALRATLTKQLVHNTSVLSAILASRSTQLHQLITSGATTLESLSTEGGGALRQTIAGLGPTMQAADLTLHGNEIVNSNLARALVALGPVVTELPSGLHNLTALANSADPAVRRLQAPVTKLVPLATALRPLADDLSSALTQLKPQVPTVDKITTYLAECTTGLNEFFNWDLSMLKFADQQGPMVRGNPLFAFYTLPITKQSSATYSAGYQCDGGEPIAGVPIPKFDGPPPAP